MRRTKFVVSPVLSALLILCAAAITSEVEAQQSSQLQVGARIRLYPHQQKPRTGILTRADADSISYVNVKDSHSQVTLARDNVSKVQVAYRNHPLGALKFSLIGLGVGAISGALLGAATYDGSCDIMVCSRGANASLAGAVFGVLGFGVGFIGGAVRGTERWHDVPASAKAALH